MTVPAASPTFVQIPGNGTATVFSAPMKIFQASDVLVGFIVAGAYAAASGYTVSSIDSNAGFTVTFATAPPSGTTVDLRTQVPLTQTTEFANLSAYLPENTTEAMDRITRSVQDLYRLVYTFGIHGPDTESTPWTALPNAAGRANTGFVWDANGMPSVGVLPTTALTQAIWDAFLSTTSQLIPTLGLGQTPAELAASVTPADDTPYVEGDVRRYGAKGDGTTDDRSAFVQANAVGKIIVTGGLNYRMGSSFTATAPLFIDAGSSIAMDNGTLLTLQGPLTQRSASPFTGLGSVVFNYVSIPGRIAAKLSGFAAGVPFYSEAPYDAFGDSYTAGMGATSGTTCFAAILGARFNGVFNNRGVSGTGVTKAIVEAFTFLPPYKCKQRTITWMAGFNDLVRQGAKTTTLQKISDCTNAFLANAFLEFCVPASDASVTLTGTWAGVTPTVLGDKASTALNGTGEFTNTLNDTASWTFNGESVVVGFWSSDGTVHTMSPFTVSIDGNLVDTVTPEGATDGNQGGVDTYQGCTHNVRVYTSLGSGSHTIVLTNTANHSLFIDYFGTLSPPGECPSVLMAEIPFMNGAGYAIETLRSRAIDTSTNLVEEAVVKQWQLWGYPVAWVPTNDYYDVTLNAYSDNIHPDQAGHVQLAQGFTSRAFPALMSALMGCTVVKSATQSTANSTTTPISWDGVINNLDGFWASGSPTILTMPAAGTIRVSGNIGFAGNATGVRAAVIYKNAVAWKTVGGAAATTGNATIMGFSMDIVVNAGDTIALEASQSSGGALNITTDTQMDVAYVR